MMKRFERKGQMSFDLAFAIVMVLLVIGSTLGYSQIAEKSSETGRVLMQLNTVADFTYRGINSFYNSLLKSRGNSTYAMELPEIALFVKEVDVAAATAGDVYTKRDYKLVIETNPASLTVSDAEDPTSVITRSMNYEIECLAGDFGTGISPGKSIVFDNCNLKNNGDLSCEGCYVQ